MSSWLACTYTTPHTPHTVQITLWINTTAGILNIYITLCHRIFTAIIVYDSIGVQGYVAAFPLQNFMHPFS